MNDYKDNAYKSKLLGHSRIVSPIFTLMTFKDKTVSGKMSKAWPNKKQPLENYKQIVLKPSDNVIFNTN